MALDFDGLGFVPSYAVEVEPEFPGDGSWGMKTVSFQRDGEVTESFTSRWGSPVILRVTPNGLPAWIGMFESGASGMDGSCATPDPDRLCVLTQGWAYVVDARAPERGAVVAQQAVSQLVVVEDPELLLLVSVVDIVALGLGGIAWRSGRIALDGLRVEVASSTAIVCSCETLEGTATVTLDPRSGEQLSRTDSYRSPSETFGDPISPGESHSLEPDALAGALHDAYIDYDTLYQRGAGTEFAGFVEIGSKRYRYRALIEGSAGFEVEDEEHIGGNFIGDVLLVDGNIVFEGAIPGRFRVHGPVGLTRVQADREPFQTRRWFRWRSTGI